jgi:hypothetical protein
MNCAHPIDVTVLADYWVAGLPDSEEEAVDEHLLGCDECGGRLREVIALADGVRKLARGGTLRMIVSDVFLQCAAEDGLRIREHLPPAGGSFPCTVHAEDDLLIVRMAATMSGAAQVDLSICDDAGVERIRYRDIPVPSGASSIAFQESIAAQKAAPSYTLIARLVAVNEAGAERLLGEYTLNHTRSRSLPD